MSFDLQPFVDRLLVRSVLNSAERQAILDLPTKRVLLPARQDFVRLDEETDHSCYVASGLVARVGQVRSGARQITAFHIPGDVADLHSAVRPIGLGGMTTLCETIILRIPHTAIRLVAAEYPAVAEAFWRDCMLDAAVLMEWVVNIGRRSATSKLAHMFCELALRYGRDLGVLKRYAFPATQEQVGDAAGLTGVHVNRSMRLLREAGLMTFRNGVVEIHDWAGLVHLAEFDEGYLLADTKPERQVRLLTTASPNGS